MSEINMHAIEITLLEYSIKKKESEDRITNPEANPSKPSIQLNAFTSAVIQKTVTKKLIKGGSKITKELFAKKEKSIAFIPIPWLQVIDATINWKTNLKKGDNWIKSSISPNKKIKAEVTNKVIPKELILPSKLILLKLPENKITDNPK